MSATDSKREFLRHTLATLAYRGAKPLKDAPPGFAEFSGAGRTPGQILAHLGDLLDWALSIAEGATKWNDSKPMPWEQERARFFAALKRLDDFLASNRQLQTPAEKLFQGPIADALTHVGQLAMMRRLADAPIVGESYFVADIETGRVGAEQSPPRKPFA